MLYLYIDTFINGNILCSMLVILNEIALLKERTHIMTCHGVFTNTEKNRNNGKTKKQTASSEPGIEPGTSGTTV